MDINLIPLFLFLMKIFCFFIGYLIVRLGYKLVDSGVKGDFKFTSNYKGAKLGLVSSSPGLLFVLLGVILIGYAMYVDKPFSYTGTDSLKKKDTIYRPPIPPPVDTLK